MPTGTISWPIALALASLQHLSVAVLASCAVALLAFVPPANSEPTQPNAKQADSRPNVVWILLDACRAQNLGCYGYERPTSPNLDQLAATGVIFNQAYAQGFGTTFSVPSYMTGRFYPVSCLETDDWRDMTRIPPTNEKLLPSVFADNGYETILVTTHPWFTPECRLWKAFEKPVMVPPPAGEAYAPFRALNTATIAALSEPHARPFFLYIHALDTHFPHKPKPGYDQWVDKGYQSELIKDGVYAHPQGNAFTEADRQLLRGLYDGDMKAADDALGGLIGFLKAQGLFDNTIFIVGSDHGDLLGEDGATAGHPDVPCHELVHVPLILAGPGIAQGQRIDALVQNADIMPTLIDILDLHTPAQCDGKSLRPLWTSPSPRPLHQYVFTKRGHHYDSMSIGVLRDTQYVLEWDTQNGSRQLYKAPDFLAGRVDVLGGHGTFADRMGRYLRSETAPLLKKYLALKRAAPTTAFIEPITAGCFEHTDSVYIHTGGPIPPTVHSDNRWFFEDSKIWSNGHDEDAPPLTLTFQVPNGTYRIQAELYSNANQGGRPASAMSVRVQQDAKPKIVATENKPEVQAYVFVDIGEYTCTDGQVRITIDEADREHWLFVTRFRFVPVQPQDKPGEGRDPRQDQLRSLGYL